MREMIKLFMVILIFSAVSGGLLTVLHTGTEARIEYQEIKFVKGPTLVEILEGASNDPLVDRFKLADGEQERDFYVGVFDGNPNIVALETFGKGYEGEIGVIVAINVENDQILGIGVTTHSETPGVGARAKTDLAFRSQFEELAFEDPIKVRADGGQIDAISGATLSSQGVCSAVDAAGEIYKRLKPSILEKLSPFKT
jgi:electron transport complex protein RnfG